MLLCKCAKVTETAGSGWGEGFTLAGKKGKKELL